MGMPFYSDGKREKGIVMIGAGKKSERWKCAMCEMQRLYYMCVVAAILLRSVTPGPLDAAGWLLYSFPQSSATQYLLRSPFSSSIFVHYSSPLPHLYVFFVCLSSSSFSATHSLDKQDNQLQLFCLRQVFKLLLIRKQIVVYTPL